MLYACLCLRMGVNVVDLCANDVLNISTCKFLAENVASSLLEALAKSMLHSIFRWDYQKFIWENLWNMQISFLSFHSRIFSHIDLLDLFFSLLFWIWFSPKKNSYNGIFSSVYMFSKSMYWKSFLSARHRFSSLFCIDTDHKNMRWNNCCSKVGVKAAIRSTHWFVTWNGKWIPALAQLEIVCKFLFFLKLTSYGLTSVRWCVGKRKNFISQLTLQERFRFKD